MRCFCEQTTVCTASRTTVATPQIGASNVQHLLCVEPRGDAGCMETSLQLELLETLAQLEDRCECREIGRAHV